MSTLTCEPPATKNIVVEKRPTAPELWKRYHKRATTKVEVDAGDAETAAGTGTEA